MTDYRVERRLSAGLVALRSAATGVRQLFTWAPLRRPADCAACGEALAAGAGAWRPFTNQGNRWHRVCGRCVPHDDQPRASATGD